MGHLLPIQYTRRCQHKRPHLLQMEMSHTEALNLLRLAAACQSHRSSCQILIPSRSEEKEVGICFTKLLEALTRSSSAGVAAGIADFTHWRLSFPDRQQGLSAFARAFCLPRAALWLDAGARTFRLAGLQTSDQARQDISGPPPGKNNPGTLAGLD